MNRFLKVLSAVALVCAAVVGVPGGGGVEVAAAAGPVDRLWEWAPGEAGTATDLAGVVQVVVGDERRLALDDVGRVWQWFGTGGAPVV